MNFDYQKLVSFWNDAFALNEDRIKEILGGAVAEVSSLAPSIKQFEALKRLQTAEHVLDYGCGTGWASLILAKLGAKHIVACDVSPNAIKALQYYAKAYQVEEVIEPVAMDTDWLGRQEAGNYDGFFSSNVIDVLPIEIADSIIKHSARILRKGATAIFSLNYYMDPEVLKQKGRDVRGTHVYVDDILRLNLLSDEGWREHFAPYYDLEELLHYAWPGEEKEIRRLYILRQK